MDELRTADIILEALKDGKLTKEEKDEIRELLEQKDHHVQGYRTLAEYMGQAAGKQGYMQGWLVSDVYNRIYKSHINENNIANRDVSEYTKDYIKEFILESTEVCGNNKKVWCAFLTMLQSAIDAMDSDGVLNFEPPKKMDLYYLENMRRKHAIKNPYERFELDRIIRYLECRQQDAQALALLLWLAGDITMEEIAGLKPGDLSCRPYYGHMKVLKKNWTEDYLPVSTKRMRIICSALEMYPGREKEYIFMTESRGGLEKISATSLSSKLAHVCKKAGVWYMPCRCNDTIMYNPK